MLVTWMLHIGGARHPGAGTSRFHPGQLSIEFVNVGGWLTCADLALGSCAQFLAVAEHRLITSRVRSIGHLLRKAVISRFGPLPVRIRRPDATYKFRLEDCVGSHRDFILGCSNALDASTACKVTDRWFTPHFGICLLSC